MEIIKDERLFNSRTVLILGFFDGIHRGHRAVIESGVDYAAKNGLKSVLLTFTESPAKYFGKNVEYIYSRKYNYKLIEQLGVDYLLEETFGLLSNIPAEEYLRIIAERYNAQAIFTGYNYTFGYKKLGNVSLLKELQPKYDYKYFCIDEYVVDGIKVSSTNIKQLIKSAKLEPAEKLLGRYFSVKSTVIQGAHIGRKLGFPTANAEYPKDIVKLPHGVYKVNVLGKKALLNWGVKPTFGKNSEVLEVHIPNFEDDLYGKPLEIEFVSKIREERKFNNLEDLKFQINKDIGECLK